MNRSMPTSPRAVEAELPLRFAPSTSDTDGRTDRKQKPKRAPLPANLPRTEFRPNRFDDLPVRLRAQAHMRTSAVVSDASPAPSPSSATFAQVGLRPPPDDQPRAGAAKQSQVIDKGIPTAGLFAHVLVAKYQITFLSIGRNRSLVARVHRPRPLDACPVGWCLRRAASIG